MWMVFSKSYHDRLLIKLLWKWMLIPSFCQWEISDNLKKLDKFLKESIKHAGVIIVWKVLALLNKYTIAY